MPPRTARDTTAEGAPSIQTVQRAALILDSFTVSRPHLSLNEITARLGASKATAHRYTKALRAANLLLAFLAFTAAFLFYGAQVPGEAARVGGLIKGMPAETAA